ncbi:MAG: thioredoxin-dependent thiol peroxidase [Acidimicrobiia bacterium]|nr:thioredoxin-dependent thiol peroxidase [Acidimicrobiia bacterium]
MQLEPGQQAPPFGGVDHNGNEVTSDDFIGRSLVMYFYPAAFTPGCTAESCDFRDRHQSFTDAGYAIVGVSPDQPDKLARFRDGYELPFPLISDPDHVIAAAFGAWGIKKNYGREYEGLIRSTIVIGEDGTVRSAWYNVKAKGHAERVADEVLD